MTKESIAKKFGLSITISNPTGAVNRDWACIRYDVTVKSADREVWHGPYHLGVGHVKPKRTPWLNLTNDERCLLNGWEANHGARFKDKDLLLWASTAAKLAKAQKVAPVLDDVVWSLLSEGAAHFDSETFEDWCANFGYDSDSRKTERAYRDCDEIGKKLVRALGREKIEAMREAFADY